METLAEHARPLTRSRGVISRYRGPDKPACAQCGHRGGARGEAGRGFAVVADEVRKLAEKTMTSTTEVGSAIQAIQQSAGKSAQQVDRAVRHIAQANEFSNHSGEMPRKNFADGGADGERGFAQLPRPATNRRPQAREITRSINEVNDITASTSSAMEVGQRSGDPARRRSRELVQLVGK